ncbi:MAG TPA: PfkB family carbohydrate kinase [Planctomycetota bacterium]|nr:PfkB family carbohydrate kinase [Planctomycetota bacterium]
MSLLVVGTLAFDSIETPYDRRADALGGSATYFALSAAFFGGVRLVGVVGQDFPEAHLAAFRARGIDTAGVEVAAGRTFRWSGRYEADWNTRHTLETQLNVLATFEPKLPAAFRDTRYVFLANASPEVQLAALGQCPRREFVMADTMNLWIDVAKDGLLEVLRQVDGLVLNDEEARMLTGERHLLAAARKVLGLGPRFVVLKKGEHGAFLIGADVHFALPAYPVDRVVDPTGAGDSFAGGFLGYLAACQNTEPATLRRAMLYGTVTASHCVEGFSVEALEACSRTRVESRFNELHALLSL